VLQDTQKILTNAIFFENKTYSKRWTVLFH